MGELLEPARQKWSLSYNFTIVGGKGKKPNTFTHSFVLFSTFLKGV